MPTVLSTVLDHFDCVAVVAAGIFAGTALYMTIGEVPALREFGLEEQWRFFPYMYQRAAKSQSAFTAIAGIAGIAHGSSIVGAPFYRNLWIAAGSTFLGVLPYTVICMLDTYKIILDDNKRIKLNNQSQYDNNKKREILDKWVTLHLVRTASTVLSFGAMIFGLSQHQSLTLGW